MKKINVLSLFGGIECGRVAMDRLGWEIGTYYSSEFDPYPRSQTEKNFPDIIHLGDVRDVKPSELEPIDILIGGSPCFTKGNMVRTNEGYKCISEAKEGDMVLTHNGKFEKVLKTGGKLSETRFVKGMGFEITTTDEHPFFVRKMSRKWNNTKRVYDRVFSEPKWKTAKELTTSDYALIVRNKTEYSAVDPLAYFWGRYAGDGWYNESKNCVIVCDGYTSEKDMDSVMESTGLKFHKNKERTSIRYCIYDKELMLKAMEFGYGASGKKIPKFVFEYSIESKKEFVMGYIHSDGCKKKDDVYDITSVSHDLIIGTQSLVQECFRIPTRYHFTERPKKTKIEGRIVNQMNSHNIRFKFDSRKQDKAFSDEYGSWQPIKKNVPTGFCEKVYNIEVENDNSYTVHNVAVHNCQDLSIAKVGGKGLEGDKSSLFYEYVRILQEAKPKYFLLENVASMKKADRDKITEIMGVEPILINSALVSAQNRRRLYWTNIPGITQPEDRKIFLRDILEDIPFDDPRWKELDEKYVTEKLKLQRDKAYSLPATYARACPRDYLEKSLRELVICVNTKMQEPQFNTEGKSCTITASMHKEPPSVIIGQFRRGSDLRIHADQENSPTLTANMGTGGNNMPIVIKKIGEIGNGGQGNRIYSVDGKSASLGASSGGIAGPSASLILGVSTSDQIISKDKSLTINANYAKASQANLKKDGHEIIMGLAHRNRGEGKEPECNGTEKANSLTTVMSDSEVLAYEEPKYYWRKLTCKETERLQTLPDDFTKDLSNSRRYKAVGNGWTVAVIEHIFSFAQF